VQTAPGGGDRLNGLSWGFDIMEALDHSAMIGPDDRFVRVASLEELRAKRMIVAKGERCPILVIWHDDRIFALDNRCPHLGFPLHRGSLADGILTCHWHHARFDLVSGGTFDLWADDVPTAEIEVRDGEVWVASRTRYADGKAHWRNRLREGMEHNIGLVIAKAVFGLIGDGVDPRSLIREGVLFGARHRDGWGAGLTVLTALGNLLDDLPNDELCLALFQGIRRVASDCDGAVPPRPVHALAGDGQPIGRLKRWLCDWVLVRHRDGAERTVLTALAAGTSAAQMAGLMLIASTERCFADGGHVLDFVNKAFEALGLIGWEYAGTVLPSVLGELVQARGAEESDAWRHPIDLVSLLQPAFAEIPKLLAEGAPKRRRWRDHAGLARQLLGEQPADIVNALKSAIRAGASPTDLSRALAYAAALRVARFGTANEHSDWDSVHHAFTYCNALHWMLKRVCECGREHDTPVDPRWLRGIFHGAMSVYLLRFLNVPPASLPGEAGDTLADLPDDCDALRTSFLAALDRRGSVDDAARLTARYLTLGHAAHPLIATLAHAVLREDAEFHTYQSLEAAVRQYREWGASAGGSHILIAVARYLAAHSPTKRAQLQTADVARRLNRGQTLHGAEQPG
jgi:nitrite reductase/ring-hydroxylating ferredoxin subunit